MSEDVFGASEVAVMAEFYNLRIEMAREIIRLRFKLVNADGIIESYSKTVAEYFRSYQLAFNDMSKLQAELDAKTAELDALRKMAAHD